MINDHKTTLEIIISLSKKNQTAEKLCTDLRINKETLQRLIIEARHLGAKIKTIKVKKISGYKIENWEKCKDITMKWYERELSRNCRE